MIVTEKAVFNIKDGKLLLTAYNPNFSIEEIIGEVEADVVICDNLKEMIIA